MLFKGNWETRKLKKKKKKRVAHVSFAQVKPLLVFWFISLFLSHRFSCYGYK